MTTAISAVREPGVGEVLRRAVRDFYEESWRLVLLNTLLSGYVLLVLAAATFVPPALVLLLGAGWPAAALVSAAVIVVDTGSLTFIEVAESVRRSWRRGVVLAGVLAAAVVATLISFRFYGDAGTLDLAAGGRRPLPGRDLPPLPTAALAAGGARLRQTARRRRRRGRDRASAPAARRARDSGSRCWW